MTALQPRIAKEEWDVVAQLAFQIQSKNIEDAADALLLALIQQASVTTGNTHWQFLDFAVRCLEFMIPSPQVTRSLTRACIEYMLSWGLRRKLMNER